MCQVAFAAAFFVAMAVLAFTQSESDLPLTDVTRRGTFQHDYAHLTHSDFESWDVVSAAPARLLVFM